MKKEKKIVTYPRPIQAVLQSSQHKLSNYYVHPTLTQNRRQWEKDLCAAE